MKKFKRCLICKKKAVWWDAPKLLYFCLKHSEKFSDFLVDKIPKNSRWQKVRRELGQKFLKQQINNFKRNKNVKIKKRKES